MSDDLNLEADTTRLADYGAKLGSASQAFLKGLSAGNAANGMGAIAGDLRFTEMAAFSSQLASQTSELAKFGQATANGLSSYGGAAIAAFNKYGWGDDMARLSLQDVRDAMQPSRGDESSRSGQPDRTA
ncbi:hypothetical protein GCM10022225_64140 [Plantactinospora mayteni]|uniref:ESX-1 secretion-associated protein n=1 Tax=Plantactinospora mayteni TaxID=566021 RepID=A0ABQ4F0A6_9ACTN|nr:hypothetical protein [Plantactinospora mayteni]GIH00343.1 hypothetical protein Pma05_69150 [Plantactinospora mayteni]